MTSSSNHDFKKESKAEPTTSTSSSSSQTSLTSTDIFENVELQLSNLWKTNVNSRDFFRIIGAIRRGTHQESLLTLIYIHDFFDQHAAEPIAAHLDTPIINLADAFNIAYKTNPSATLNILQSFLRQKFDKTITLYWQITGHFFDPISLFTSTSEVHQQTEGLLKQASHLLGKPGPLPKSPSEPFNIILLGGGLYLGEGQAITVNESILIGEYWTHYCDGEIRIVLPRFASKLSPVCLPPLQPPLEETPYATLPKRFKTFLSTYNIEEAKWTSDDKQTRQNFVGWFKEWQQASLTEPPPSNLTNSSSSSSSSSSTNLPTSSSSSSSSKPSSSSASMFHLSEMAEFQALVTQCIKIAIKDKDTPENQALITFLNLLKSELSVPGSSKDQIIENLLSKYYQENNAYIPRIEKALLGLLSYDQTRSDKIINKAKAQAQIARTKTEPPSGCVIS